MSEIIYGNNVIEAAIVNKISLNNVKVASDNQKMIRFLQSNQVKFQLSTKESLNQLALNHQGVIAEINGFPLYSLNQLMKEKNDVSHHSSLIVVLDSLEDPHNLGAILRTVEAAGADGVVFTKNRSVKLNATVAKVSTGAIFNVKCCEVVNLTTTLKTLKDNGYWVVGTDAQAKMPYSSLKYDFPTVLIIGSEGKGISRLVLEQCDYLVSIPMVGKINSLNASVSAGIMIYEIKNKQWE